MCCGVFEVEEPRIFRQAQAGSEELLSYMQLIFSGDGNQREGRALSFGRGFLRGDDS